MPKVGFFDAKPYDQEFFELTNRDYPFELKFIPGRLTTDTVELAKGCDAICVFVNDHITKNIIDRLVGLGVKVIALRCAGYNNVDLKATYKTIPVVRVPAYSPHAVAEHAVALMLTLNRKTHRAYYRTRDNNFSIVGFMGFDLKGKVAGIIGTGKIGQELIKILNGFGMHILAFDKTPNPELANHLNFTFVGLEEIFQQSDIISLHCPLTPETHHVVNDQTIAKMKPGVMLINTGRGQLIDTQALINGLKTRKIGAAGLDVYEEESEYFFEDFSDSFIPDDVLARLLTFNNVLVTSHQGFFTTDAMTSIAKVTLNNLTEFFAGKSLTNEICYRCGSSVCVKKTKGRCF
jgi:D-lactate dehydrogenase